MVCLFLIPQSLHSCFCKAKWHRIVLFEVAAAAGVSAARTVTVTGLSAQLFNLYCLCHLLYDSLQSLLGCSALSPALTSSPSVAVSSGAAVLCGRGQQEWDGRRGRDWSTEERTLWEGWREGTVHTQNIPSKEASGRLSLSLLLNQLHADDIFWLNSIKVVLREKQKCC